MGKTKEKKGGGRALLLARAREEAFVVLHVEHDFRARMPLVYFDDDACTGTD